jgi:hypothetical protein
MPPGDNPIAVNKYYYIYAYFFTKDLMRFYCIVNKENTVKHIVASKSESGHSERDSVHLPGAARNC